MPLTHLHADHVGEVVATSRQSTKGDYKLTGAADVAEAMNVREVIDRRVAGIIPHRDGCTANWLCGAGEGRRRAGRRW